MTDITFTSDLTVTLIDHMGSDATIARAARASTGNDSPDQEKIEGLIGYLWRNRHTSPFEHCVVTVAVEAPIFVAREWERHRTQSYSELSLRFAEASPKFYVPSEERPLVNEGSGAHPKLVAGTPDQSRAARASQELAATDSWAEYGYQINAGIAHEVARNVLPLSTYTKFYATANLNNWFKFLTLRDADNALWEIRQTAIQVGAILRDLYPVAWKHYSSEGSV